MKHINTDRLFEFETIDNAGLIYRHFCSLFSKEYGTPFQYSCLDNPMDGGAWWAAVYGVAQSRTRLKRLSSSSTSSLRARVSSRGAQA